MEQQNKEVYLLEDLYVLPKEESDQVALCFNNEKYTFSDLRWSVDHFCHTLYDKGVRPGNHVALLGMNSFNWLVAFYAII